jgi:hypothetical protein
MFFFATLHMDAKAQSEAGSIRHENKSIRMALTDILGDWYLGDSLKTKISFVNEANYFVVMQGIKHGVGAYSFLIKKDSIEVNGSAPNWPPYYCTLRLLNQKKLAIDFYTFIYPGTTSVFCRRE